MKIKPQDIVNSNQSPFQTHHEARTEFPIDGIVNSKQSFLNVRENLRVGDRITVCSYQKVDQRAGTSEGLAGFATVRVVSITAEAVDLVLEAPPVKVGPVPVKVATVSKPKLNVRKVFGGGFAVMEGDHTLDQFKTKAAAEEYATAAVA